MVLFGATLVVFYASTNLRSTSAGEETEIDQVTATVVEKPSIFEAALKPLYAEAIALRIPTVNIKVNVISVGVDANGSMETPRNWSEAGWYKKGARPGENGNLILNGHYDSSTGNAAAFYTLRNVKVGAKIEVTDAFDKTYVYEVTQMFYVNVTDPDRLNIFKSDNTLNEITLITCGGVWDYVSHNYSKRLVVKGTLVNN